MQFSRTFASVIDQSWPDLSDLLSMFMIKYHSYIQCGYHEI